MKSILVDPFFTGQRNMPVLRFRLSNTGNRDVELIELEVCVPEYLLERTWKPLEVPQVLHFEWRAIAGHKNLVLWEQPFDGAIDRMHYGAHRTLSRVISPHWTPRYSDLLKIALRNDLERPEHWSIQCKVVARNIYCETRIVNLRDIPFGEQ